VFQEQLSERIPLVVGNSKKHPILEFPNDARNGETAEILDSGPVREEPRRTEQNKQNSKRQTTQKSVDLQ
jgi:hypothetical protein